MKKTTKPKHQKEVLDMARIALGDLLPTATAAEEREPKPKRDYKRLDKHLENIRIHHAGMQQSFADYCSDAREMGFTDREAWEYMYSKLKDIIPTSTLYYWGNKYLPSGTMKVTKPITTKNTSKKIPTLESSESERSTPQERTNANKSLPLSSTTMAKFEERQRPGILNEGDTNMTTEELQDDNANNGMVQEALETVRESAKTIESQKGAISVLQNDVKRYKDLYEEEFRNKHTLLRHFKLCQNCFAGEWYAIGKRTKSKIVKGVYDRGISTDTKGITTDHGWVCAKHKANDERLTKEFAPLAKKLLGSLVQKSESITKSKSKPKPRSEPQEKQLDVNDMAKILDL